ncbi:hypothetical protein T06_10771 [Trichinella sp. T6]|nr:hypothetical protein T06_10771 [Trichinella sp. T6]
MQEFTNHLSTCNSPCYTAALLIADAAGEDSGWLLATDPHDLTRRYLISHCLAGRSVIDPRARRSLMIHCGSGSKPLRNVPLIYRRDASRETVSKTIWDQISVHPPRCPLRRKPSIYWSGEDREGSSIFSERER